MLPLATGPSCVDAVDARRVEPRKSSQSEQRYRANGNFSGEVGGNGRLPQPHRIEGKAVAAFFADFRALPQPHSPTAFLREASLQNEKSRSNRYCASHATWSDLMAS